MKKLLLVLLLLAVPASAQVVIPGTGGGTVVTPAGTKTPVVPGQCTGTDKVIGVTSTGQLVCNVDIGAAGAGISTLNTLTTATQLFAKMDDTNVTLTIASVTDTHTFTLGWTGELADARVSNAITLDNLTQITTRAISDTTGTLGLSRGGTNQTAWTASRCVQVNASGTALESAAAACGAGGGNSFSTIGLAVADSSADTLTVTDSGTIDFTTTNDPEDLTAIVIANSIGPTQVDETANYTWTGQHSFVGAELLGASPIRFEGATDNNIYTIFSFTDPTVSNKTVTIPNADSNTVQPLTCSGTDKVSAISAVGVITCTTDQGGAGSGDNLRVEDGDNAGTFTAMVDADFDDSGDINFVRTAGPPDIITALVRADSVALATDTTGDFVASITAGAGLASTGATTGENIGHTLSTASGEANFLASGALTCGAATQGKAQVHTTPLQYCDNAATPALQYAAYGDSTGNALAGDSATSFFSSGTLEDARLSANVSLLGSSISLTTEVTGILPGANGGTNNGFMDFTGPATSLKTFTLPNASSTILTTNAAVTSAQGGTGANNTATTGRYLRGDGTNFLTSSVAAAGAGSCTNQFVRSANDNAVPTCASVATGDVTDANITPVKLSAAAREHIVSMVVLSPTTSLTSLVQHKFANAVTISRVSCSIDAGTSVTIQLDERAEATPNTAGTNVLTASLVCDTNSEATTSFSNATIAADVPLNLQITATSGTVNGLRVHVDYSPD